MLLPLDGASSESISHFLTPLQNESRQNNLNNACSCFVLLRCYVLIDIIFFVFTQYIILEIKDLRRLCI